MSAGIILTFVIASLGLVLLLVLLLPGDRRIPSTSGLPPMPIAGLSEINEGRLDLVFTGHADYRKLAARPELDGVRRAFREERRGIVLAWLESQRADTHLVWRFRRFLVLSGFRATVRDEAAIALMAVIALAYLAFLQTIVSAFGPFALTGLLRTGRCPVERLSVQGARLIEHAPTEIRAQLRRQWKDAMASEGLA